MEDVADADIINYAEWDRRFELAKTRRQERQQQTVPEPETEHSTGVFETIKSWASNAWAWVKGRVWG